MLSFSKHQLWCPSPLGWDRVYCLAKNGGNAKTWSAISYVYPLDFYFWSPWLERHAVKSIFKTCFRFQNIKFGVKAPLVVTEFTVWQKNGGRDKAWSAISYTLLISTFRNLGKKGMQPTAFFKCAFIFKTSSLVSKMPWLRYG